MNNPIKNGQKTQIGIFRMPKQMAKWAHENMLNIANYERNANQNNNEIAPHTCPNGYIIKECTNNKYWKGCGEKETFVHCWWECKLVHRLWKTVWRVLKKLKIELPYDPAIPLLSIYLGKKKKIN